MGAATNGFGSCFCVSYRSDLHCRLRNESGRLSVKRSNMTAKDYSQSPRRFQNQRKLRQDMLALTFYTTLAVIVTWPALSHLGDRVLGAYPGDNFQFLWALWYTAHAIFDLHSSPFFDPDIYFPFGFSLFRNLGEVSPATIFASVPLTRCLGEVATYNLLIIISFALTGFGTFLLARELRAGFPGALVAGIGVGFCAYHFAHAAGHLSLASTQWIPFFFLYLERTLRKPTIQNGILLGLFYALSALVSWYYASLLPIAAVLYLSFRFNYFKEPKRFVRVIKPGLVAAACAAVLILPFAVPYVLALKQGTMETRSVEESQAFSASVADFFIPPIRHLLWGHWVAQHWRSGANGLWGEWELYLGTLILPLALLGILYSKNRRITAGLIAIGVGAFLLALGPTLYFVHPSPLHGAANLAPLSHIPLPVMALKEIPPFSFLRGWARMGFFLELAMSLLAAKGCTYLLDLIGHRSMARYAVALTIVGLATLDSIVFLGMASVAPRSVDRWLAAQPGKFPVMEYPIPEHAYSGPAMYSTRFTGKQIIMGYASNPPNLHYFPTLSTFPSPAALDLLQRWGTKYVLVDETLYKGGSQFWNLWQTWRSLEAAIHDSDRLEEVTKLAGIHVYRFRSPETQTAGPQLLSNPGFKSGPAGDVPGWTAVGHPKIDRSGSRTHDGSGSCFVTMSDYLVSNSISINPGQCYLLELFSRSGKSRAARVSLQIVWQDALHHPLDPTTTSVRVIDTDEPWELAHAEFLSPPESRYAIIYAKTDTGAAWLDDYSFRQLASNCDPILKAVPNPAVQMPGTNQSRASLSWDSHAGASSYVGVSVNHQPEMHFVEGPEGMRFFDIEAKAVWEFRLYAGKGNNPIKTATVTSEEISPLSASPVVFTSSSLLGTTTISWNMPAHPEAEVWVSQNGGPENLFVRGASGAQQVPWIARGSTYEFRMYAELPERKLVGQLVVGAPKSSP